MKKGIYVAGGIVLAFGLAMAAANGCGSKGSSNPVSSSLDSLPNANLTQGNVISSSASTASSAAASNSSVPTTSQYTSGGTAGVSPLMLRVLSTHIKGLPIEQKNLVLKALSVKPQTVTGTCPVITDNSTYPSGTAIDVTWDYGSGCTPSGTSIMFSGSYSVKGTISDSAGTVSVTLTYNNTAFQVSCGPGENVNVIFNGSLTVTGNGLISASSSFSVVDSGSLSVSVSGSCNGQSVSGSGFSVINVSLSGTKSGSEWIFTVSDVSGEKYSFGSVAFGAYQDWAGTIDIDTAANPATATANLSGRIGWEIGSIKGKVAFSLINVVINDAVCYNEPVSGTLELTAGSNTADVYFDGTTNTCGGAPWSLNGVSQGILNF